MNRRHFLLSSSLLLGSPPIKLALAAPEGGVFDDILEPVRKKHDLPALAAAVVVKDKIISGAVGFRKVGDPTPVTKNDQFHLGSCTKSLTGTLAGILVEEGKLKWESTVAEVLPDLADKMRAEFRPVTLEQLVSHRAGLAAKNSPSVASLKSLLDDGTLGTLPRQQRHKFVELILQDPPALPPGTKFAYSNQGFVTAAVMLEAAADAPWEELMQKRLFDPLEMTTAGFGPMGTAGKLDQPLQHRVRGGERTALEPGPLADNPPVIGPAGTVHCSAEDWGKYAREHIRGPRGESKLATAKTFERLHTPPLGGEYAAGWFVSGRDASGATLSHNGSNGGNFTLITVNTRGWAVMTMTNQGGDSAAKALSELPSALVARAMRS